MTKCLGKLLVLFMAMVLCGCVLLVGVSYADTDLQSPNYRFTESTVGNGGLIHSSSTNFQSSGDAVGSTAVGNSGSTNYQFNSGPVTTADPALGFAVTSAAASFGNFNAAQVATATASFTVSDYTSYGYAVQVLGNPPSNGSHTLPAMASTDISRPGQEQFGINLVANTGFGANPDQGLFGKGVAAANYNTADHFRYVNGETIASAPKSSGITVFTISYIINVSNITPGGAYTASQSVVCTGTF